MTTTQTSDVWVLEYFPATGALAIALLSDVIDQNRERYLRGEAQIGWFPIFIGTSEQCEKALTMAELWTEIDVDTHQTRH